MTSYQEYVIFESIKEFVSSLCDCYKDEVDEPVHMFNAYLNKFNISMKESKQVIDDTIQFCNDNKEAINAKEISLFPKDDVGLVFDEDAYVNVVEYLNKGDSNTDVILDHLNSILYLVEGGPTAEANFLDTFVKGFEKSIGSADLPKLDLGDPSSGDMSDEVMKTLGDVIEPTIEKSLNDFQTKNLSIDSFMKSISFKVKDYIQKNELPGVKKEELNEILDMTIENDISELLQEDKKFEIFAKLSGSGLLAHLPLGKIMSLIPKSMEGAFNSGEELDLKSLSLE
jgi:hypothetical protein